LQRLGDTTEHTVNHRDNRTAQQRPDADNGTDTATDSTDSVRVAPTLLAQRALILGGTAARDATRGVPSGGHSNHFSARGDTHLDPRSEQVRKVRRRVRAVVRRPTLFQPCRRHRPRGPAANDRVLRKFPKNQTKAHAIAWASRSC